MSIQQKPSIRVNGALLPTYTGQQVVVVGTVNQVDPSGSSVMITASDGKVVRVTLPNPLQENLDGVIEVHGVGQGMQVLCQNYVTFPQMSPTDFDVMLYNDAVKLTESIASNPWKPKMM